MPSSPLRGGCGDKSRIIQREHRNTEFPEEVLRYRCATWCFTMDGLTPRWPRITQLLPYPVVAGILISEAGPSSKAG